MSGREPERPGGDREKMVPPEPQYRPIRDHDGADTSMRNLALAAIAIAAVVMGGVYMMSGRHHDGVPVIEADSRPLRVKPTDPGGMQVANSDDAVPTDKNGAEADQLLPPPEAPAPQMLQQQAHAASAPPPAQPAPPAAAVPQAIPAPAPPQAAPKPALPVATANPPPPIPTPHGHVDVQLAALDSEAAANATWVQLTHRMPALLAGHTARVVRVDRDGRAFWRLRTGGFADIASATAFCTAIHAKGGACTIASF